MFKNLNPFRAVPAQEQAQHELAQAERDLLDAQSAHDYAGAMVNYHRQRIARLHNALHNYAQRAD